MPTLRQIVSSLAGDIKAISLDDRVSFRYLAGKFQDAIAYFLRLEARSREMFKDLSLWKTIRCVELDDSNPSICGYTDTCSILKKSKVEIPEAFNTNYGLLIKVLTLDGFTEFKMIKSFDYKDYINREYTKNSNFVFWLEDKYLYIPNVDIKAVKVLIIPKDPSAIDKLNCDITACASPLDGEVSYPPYLIKLAKDEVIKVLFPRKNMVEDEKPDDNTNIKV